RLRSHSLRTRLDKGEFMGIPPTNRSFEVLDITIVEIHDGKLTAHWGLTDETAMMQQLGLASEM
ncbi:MAG: ester cyclase, partial [Gemmatimonadales bacterium]